MGKSTNLPDSITDSRAAIIAASSAIVHNTAILSNAANDFASFVAHIQQQAGELEGKALQLQKAEEELAIKTQALEETRIKLAEREMELNERETLLAEKEKEWQAKQQRLEANAEKLENIVQLNVGGQLFEVPKSTLMQYKGSYFEDLLTADTPQQVNGKIFIDYNPKHFQTILDYLRTKTIRKSDMVFKDELQEDFAFFRIPFVSAPPPTLPCPPLQSSASANSIIPQPLVPPAYLLNSFVDCFNRWLPRSSFVLLYKGTRDGFKASDFHKACDHRGPTISLIQTTTGNLFGGYAPIPWGRTNGYDIHSNFFLFTLVNPSNVPPTRFLLKSPSQPGLHNGYNVTFGAGHDIYIADSANKNNHSHSNFGVSYENTTGYGPNALTEGQFSVQEIEVYTVL